MKKNRCSVTMKSEKNRIKKGEIVMKKFLVILIALLVMSGIVCLCVKVYQDKINEIDSQIEEPLINPHEEKVDDVDAIEVSSDPIFTEETYPKMDAPRLYHPLAKAIKANMLAIENEDVKLDLTLGRNSEVYHNLIDGNVDVIISVDPDPDDVVYAKEKGVDLTYIPLTGAAFVFFVNTENSVDNLTAEQIRQIYEGKITNWKEVSGDDAEIIAYQRPRGSGSQTAMISVVMPGRDLVDPEVDRVAAEMYGIIEAVADYDNSKNALGYGYYYYVNTMYKKDTIKILNVDGIEANNDTIRDEEYPFYTKGYIVVRTEDYEKKDSDVMKWVDTMLSQRGTKIINDEGYVPLNK